MAKEIDHRVMNSLQLVSGLLDMQSRGVGSSETAEQLALASSRVATIAQVHRHIYQSDGGVDKVGCKGYLERLCAELSRTLPSAESDAIAVVSDDVELPTAQIVPLGLIVNELVTNSVKHGASRITVSFIREATGGYVLTVSDDGTGLPADLRRALNILGVSKLLAAVAATGSICRGSSTTIALLVRIIAPTTACGNAGPASSTRSQPSASGGR